MDPPIEASGGQEQYYVNGLILWNGTPSRDIWWSRALLHEWAHSVKCPSKGIWWSRAVLHEWAHSVECPPIKASGGQEQYYVNELILWNGPPVEASGGQEHYYMNGLILWNGPPVETSHGQEQYYVNGLIPWNRPPGRSISWSRAVVHEWAHSVECPP